MHEPIGSCPPEQKAPGKKNVAKGRQIQGRPSHQHQLVYMVGILRLLIIIKTLTMTIMALTMSS